MPSLLSTGNDVVVGGRIAFGCFAALVVGGATYAAAGEPPAKKGAQAIAAPSAAAARPTNEECRAWAQSMEQAVGRADLEKFNRLLDWDALLDTATEIPNETRELARRREEFIAGLKGTAQNKRNGFGASLMAAAKGNGSYTFLRVQTIDGRRRAMFRAIQPNGGLAYHGFILAHPSGGPVAAVDCFIFLVGEMYSQSVRQMFLPILARWSHQTVDQLAPAEKDFVTHLGDFAALSQAVQDKKFRDALDAYARLPASVQKNKTALALRLVAARTIGQTEYLAAIDDYRKYHPTDATLDFICVDSFILRRSYDRALAGLDRIDTAVGGDPYLRLLRARVFELEGKDALARKQAEQARSEEPTLLNAYNMLLHLALKERNFPKTLEILTLLESKFGMRFNDLSKVPVYADFVNSAEYKKWLETHPPQTEALPRP